MPALTDILRFVNRLPQVDSDGSINYLFIGGTAVRLNEELYRQKTEDYYQGIKPRELTDLDIVALKPRNYDVHNCQPQDVFLTLSIPESDIPEFTKSVDIRGTDVHFLDEHFTTATKSVFTPRDKDYEDVCRLYSLGLDENKLSKAFSYSQRTTKNPEVLIPTFEKIMGLRSRDPNLARKMFRSFPSLVNLLDSLSRDINLREAVYNKIQDYTLKETKDGYQIGSILLNLNEILDVAPRELTIDIIDSFLDISIYNDYREIDKETHYFIVPALKWAGTDKEKIEAWNKIKTKYYSQTDKDNK